MGRGVICLIGSSWIEGREIPPLRKPTRSQEANAEKRRRLAPVGMTLLGSGSKRSKEFVSEEESDFGEEDVAGDDHYIGDDDGLCCGAAYALCAAADGEAFVAADGGEDETVNQGLHHSLHDIGEIEGVDVAGPEFNGAEAQRKNGGEAAAEKTDKVGEHGEQRKNEDAGDDARGDEFARWVGAHGAHGIDLHRDAHGAELGGDA